MSRLFVGDLHLNKHLKSFGRDNTIVYDALRQVLRYARNNYITHIDLLGDIFDGPYPSQAQIAEFAGFLAESKDITWNMIAGNHDIENDNCSLETLKFMTRFGGFDHVNIHLHATVKEVAGIRTHYMPYGVQTPRKNCLNVAHLSLNGAKMDNGVIIKDGVLPGKFDWIIGHIHEPQKFYPGTPYQVTFGEKPNKGFIHLDRNEKKFIKLRPFYTLETKIVYEQADLDFPEEFKDVNLGKTLFKLKIAEQVFLPHNYQILNPQVVKIEPLHKGRGIISSANKEEILPEDASLQIADFIDSNAAEYLQTKGYSAASAARIAAKAVDLINKLEVKR